MTEVEKLDELDTAVSACEKPHKAGTVITPAYGFLRLAIIIARFFFEEFAKDKRR